MRQLTGFAGERRQDGKVAFFQGKNVSVGIYTDVGTEQGESESVVFDLGVVNDHKHQILPFRLPGLWISDSLCPIPPISEGGLYFGFWREVIKPRVPEEQEGCGGEKAGEEIV